MQELWQESLGIWKAGGPLMIPLAVIAFGLFYAQARLFFQIKDHRPNPPEADSSKRRHIPQAFESVRDQILQPIDRKIRFYGILVGICPLLGLLGTVTGMTSTFTGMSQPGASNLSVEVAGGVSEALVTTQAGLLVAIPGMILLTLLRRGRDRIALDYYALEAEALKSQSQSKRNEGATPFFPAIP